MDQMNMAVRCGKRNIVEGCEDAMTSSAMEVNLVNVGRSSFQEQDARMKALEVENAAQKQKIAELEKN